MVSGVRSSRARGSDGLARGPVGAVTAGHQGSLRLGPRAVPLTGQPTPRTVMDVQRAAAPTHPVGEPHHHVQLRLRAAGASATWAPPAPHWRTGRVEVVLPGGSEVAIVEDDDSVHVGEHHLDDARESELLADPMAFLGQLAAPSTGRHPRSARGRVPELLQEHRAASFPARLRGEEVAGVDAVVVDADVVGIVVSWLDGGQRLSRTHERLPPRLMADLEAVLDELEDPDEVTHHRRLRTTARDVIGASQRRTGR